MAGDEDSDSPDGSALSKSWVVIVAAVIGTLTLLFLMALVLFGVAGHQVPCESRYLVSIVLSFGAAMSAAFLGGNAAANGRLPIPGLQSSPLFVSASGGTAVLVVMLILTSHLFDAGECDNGLAISCQGNNRTMSPSCASDFAIRERVGKSTQALCDSFDIRGASVSRMCSRRCPRPERLAHVERHLDLPHPREGASQRHVKYSNAKTA